MPPPLSLKQLHALIQVLDRVQYLVQLMGLEEGECSKCGRRIARTPRSQICVYCLFYIQYPRQENPRQETIAGLQDRTYFQWNYGQNAKVPNFVEGKCLVCKRATMVDPRGNICSHCAVDHMGEPIEPCDESSCPHSYQQKLVYYQSRHSEYSLY